MKVMIVVTHLLGTGHLARAVTLAQAFKRAGDTPLVVSGGLPVSRFEASGIEILQLPAVRSDGVDFSKLLDAEGGLVDRKTLQDRMNQLIDTIIKFQPNAVITELFPFGRRILRDEFKALLEHAHTLPHPPAIFGSIRDILAPPSKPQKATYADQIIATHYDAVLVHADPKVTPLELSWPVSDTLRPKLCYTGFVAPPPARPHPDGVGINEIIVSAGGGAVGQNLFDCARSAAANDPTRIWRLLIGGQDAEGRIGALRTGAPKNLIVEATRPDFRQMLHHAQASVSFCGYNTAQDLLQTTCPAVFIPFDEGGEVEQSIRARALCEIDGIEMLSSGDMTPATLLASVNAAIAAPPRQPGSIADGAAKTVEILRAYCGLSDEI